MIAFAGLITLLTLLFYRFPEWHMVTWAAIGLTSAAAMAVGVVVNRPRRRLPWIILIGALVAFTAGDTAYNVLTRFLGQEQPFPSAADVIYLGLFFPLLAAGLLGLTRTGTASRDRASVLDALTLTIGVGLLFWLFLIEPRVHSDAPLLDRAISVAYPLCDVLLLAVSARLVTAVRWSPAVLLLGTGGLGLLAADVIYGLAQVDGTWQIGGPVDLGWVAFYACFGLAALHPSMTRLTAPRPVPTTGLRPWRLVVLALATLIAPAVALTQALNGAGEDAAVAAVVAAVMFLLVIARLHGAMSVHRAAVAREQTLRRAAVALVAATSADEVDATMRNAITGLLPPGAPHRVLRRGASRDGQPGRAGVQLLSRDQLAGEDARRLGDFGVVAHSRLVIGEPPRTRDYGSLFVAADATALLLLHESLQVLAAQAAFALNRIGLNEEINRQNSEAYFRTLVQNASDVILIIDVDGRVRYASPSSYAVFGRPDIRGRALHDLVVDVPPLGQDRPGVPVDEVLDEWLISRPDGGTIHAEASIRDLRHDPTVAGFVVTLRDVTSQRRLQDELAWMAFHDDLTGLANRVLFSRSLDQTVAASRSAGTVAGVLFIDLDDFKIVNDTMGHATGDALLQAVSERLRATLRPGDVAARLGGDEFAALVEGADVAAIEDVAARVVEVLREPFTVDQGLVNGNASVGVATTADAADGADLMRQSDMALYVAKQSGKNQWRRYQTAVHNTVLRRMQTRNDLDHALRGDAFSLRYQPVVHLGTGRTVGFEALIRWHHPTRGTLGPDEFIGVAEESGLIVPIGEWVLDTALSEAATWDRRHPGDAPSVGVNISARQLRQPGFVDTVLGQLRRHALPPDRLVLEITESLLLRDNDKVWADLASLREAGVRIAIDDFGTGYSSLSYLREVPADILKIERSFIGAAPTSDQQRAMVDSIVHLATTLDLSVIAEGIEQKAERDVLAQVGCRYGQGHLFSPPLSPHHAATWLQRERIPA